MATVPAATAATGATSARALAALLLFTGVTHFVRPQFFDAIVPRVLPGPARAYTVVSGLAELACAAGLLHHRTRRPAALTSAALFAALLPANVQMALDWRDRSTIAQVAAWARLPLQLPLVWWALRIRRRTP